MTDKISSNLLKGVVTITISDGNKTTSIIKNNAILSNAKHLLSRLLGGLPGYVPNAIQVYKDNTLLAESKVHKVDFTGDTVARFTADFPSSSFTETQFNKLKLKNNPFGDFSICQNFLGTKQPSEKVSISWEINII